MRGENDPVLGPEEVRVDVARALRRHEDEAVRADRPASVVPEAPARLEVEERLLRLEPERERRPVVRDGRGLEVAVPVEVGPQDDPPLGQRVAHAQLAPKDGLGPVEIVRRRGLCHGLNPSGSGSTSKT